jgi:hypothetical protein
MLGVGVGVGVEVGVGVGVGLGWGGGWGGGANAVSELCSTVKNAFVRKSTDILFMAFLDVFSTFDNVENVQESLRLHLV